MEVCECWKLFEDMRAHKIFCGYVMREIRRRSGRKPMMMIIIMQAFRGSTLAHVAYNDFDRFSAHELDYRENCTMGEKLFSRGK